MSGQNGNYRPIKSEPTGFDGQFKQESYSQPNTPSQLDEEDIYEDAGDLDFSQADQNAWLVRLPNYVWDSWSKIGEDEEIRLGTVRMEPGADGKQKVNFALSSVNNCADYYQVSLLLATEPPANRGLPREYTMAVTNAASSNTFIFSEQDLPQKSFKGKGPGRNVDSKNSKDRLAPGDRRQWERYSRYQPYIRKPIPKQTALTGAVKHEVSCYPVENAEFMRIMAQRNRDALKPKHQTMFVPMQKIKDAQKMMAPGTLGGSGGMENFIKTASSRATKASQDNKATRMPRNELRDAIFACYRKYNYWSLKSMKAELHQPETWLKENLEQVAVLVRSGQFALTYTLKPEYREGELSSLSNDMAPESSYGYDGAGDVKGEQDDELEDYLDDDEDEDDKMEDVPL
jgi:transcription initiation factor TFIIF subunit beta